VDSNATLTVSNQISGGGSLIKASPGTLVLNGSNDFSGTLYVDTGSTTASDGITSITTSNALAGVPVSPGTATIVQQDNNSGYSTLQLNGTTGPINLSQEISMDCRNTTNPNLDNVAGNNYLGGNIDIYQGGSSVYLQADAGTLTLAGNLQYVGALANPRAFTFQGRGNFVVTGQILAATTVVAPVSVQMSGTGILTLSGNNTYESSTTVSSGELLLLGSINSTNGLTAAGGDLAGTGMINDNVTIQALGSLTPGLGNGSIGTLTISSNLTLAGLASMDINKSTHASDQVTGLASIMYGGTLAVTNLAGTLVLGDSFTLFSAASSSGNFASVVGNPGSGLAYRFNPTNGVVSVITGTASNPTNITASVSGRTLTLTWPEDHLGWILQSETNAASIGLGTNFVDVAGSSASTNAIFTINPLNPTVFFRLRHP
jgi:autotransporter-associated beta strand protein